MNTWRKTLIIVVALGILGYVAYREIGKWHVKRLETATELERNKWKDTSARLEEKVAELGT